MDYDYWNNHLSMIGGTLIAWPITYAAYVNKPGIEPTARLIVLALFGIPAVLGTLHIGKELYKGLKKRLW
ncbi:MAG: hypothetical protein ABEJ56_05715 [Candidatus Nanohaloarchaea archaeon]